MKQKWKFHQRWRRRYFRLKGHKLYYSKDVEEVCININLFQHLQTEPAIDMQMKNEKNENDSVRFDISARQTEIKSFSLVDELRISDPLLIHQQNENETTCSPRF